VSENRTIYCCGCQGYTWARLTNGLEIYPHRDDLHYLPFWKCDVCANYVGCHHKTLDRTRPLGVIPTASIKAARQSLHAVIDPLWQNGKISRKKLYAKISKRIGKEYHAAEIRSVEEANNILAIAAEIGSQS